MKFFRFILCASITLFFVFLLATTFGQDTTSVSGNQEGSILDELLSGMSINYFIAMMIYAMVGLFSGLISDTVRRNKNSDSPSKFSFKYWWKDNKRRVLASVLIIPVAILTCSDLLNVEINGLNSFFIGFSADHISELLKRKNIIKGAYLR